MKIFIRVLWACVLVALIAAAAWCVQIHQHNPALRPDDEIQAEVLALTPLGTDIAHVQGHICNQWGKMGQEWADKSRSTDKYKPKKALRMQYGSYVGDFRNWLVTAVNVDWFFDEKGRLDEVAVVHTSLVP